MRNQDQPGRSLPDLTTRLPGLIEKAVTARVEALASDFKKEIAGTQTRVLETFVKDVQEKLADRISAIETGMTGYADEMKQLRTSAVRTEDNLTRLLSSIDKLTQGLPAPQESTVPLLAAPPSDREDSIHVIVPVERVEVQKSSRPAKRKARSRHLPAAAFWAVMLILAFAVSARLLRKPHHPAQSFSDSAATAVPAPADSSLSKSPFVSNFSGTMSTATAPLTGAEIK